MKMKINLGGIFKNAQELSQLLLQYESDIDLKTGHYIVNGKSLFGILSLNFNNDLILTVNEKKNGDFEKIRNIMKNKKFLVEEL